MPIGIYRRSNSIKEYLDQRSVKIGSGCIIWVGSKTKDGYGSASKDVHKTTAHRLSYICEYGSIPSELEIDHVCKNILCINPSHLEAVTHLENVRRCDKSKQSHCIHGHEFTEENTYRKLSNGTRVCRACAAFRQRRLRMLNPEPYRLRERNYKRKLK